MAVKNCQQRGATAVEFAFVFPILFLLVYGVIVYAYVYVLQQSITFAAQHSAESVAKVDPSPAETYDQRLGTRIRATASEQLSWLPATQRNRVLGSTGDKVKVDFAEVDGSSVVRVTLTFELTGLFPVVSLPVLGPVPPLPAQLSATASART